MRSEGYVDVMCVCLPVPALYGEGIAMITTSRFLTCGLLEKPSLQKFMHNIANIKCNLLKIELGVNKQ